MFLSLFENIRELTHTANNFVQEHNIEQCNIALVERQKLIENLFEKVSNLSESNPQIKDKLIELLDWIQVQDKPNVAVLITEKKKNIKNSIKQVQANKAIKQYNITL